MTLRQMERDSVVASLERLRDEFPAHHTSRLSTKKSS